MGVVLNRGGGGFIYSAPKTALFLSWRRNTHFCANNLSLHRGRARAYAYVRARMRTRASENHYINITKFVDLDVYSNKLGWLCDKLLIDF